VKKKQFELEVKHMGFSLKVTTTLAIGVIHIKSFMKLSKTFLIYASNVFVQRKNYKHGDSAFH
jgi:hypothetical protein